MNLRQNIFWLIDKLKGHPLKKVHNYTLKILETEDRDQVNAENALQLGKLLNHASKTTQFYKNIQTDSLQNYPVVNKNIIRQDFDAFFSSDFQKSNCKKVTTSGSTGSPFSLYQNSEKVRKIQSDNIYFSSKSKFEIGNFLAFVRIWPKRIGLQLKVNFLIKNFMPWNILEFSDEDISKFIRRLNRKRGTVSFLTYPTALEKMCKYMDKLDENPIKFKTKSIITMSEALNDYTRKQTAIYFGVVPLSRYSNNETGIMAQQLSAEDSRFRINDSSYVMEVLELDSDKPVPKGAPGRIVLTDLFNFAMPLIRYDTGDIGVMEMDERGVPYFEYISGRKVDQLYDTQGRLIPSHISLRLMDYGKFNQFQLVQKSQYEYHIILNTKTKVDESKIINDFKAYFGEDALIKVIYVDEIPVLESGKRREVVNEFYN